VLRWGSFVLVALIVLGAGVLLASAVLDRPARSYRDAVVVDAPRSAIWSLLTDFDRYPEWNPYITEGHGTATAGSTVELGFSSTEGAEAETRSATVLIVKPRRKLEWRTRILAPGVLDREQVFRVLPMRSGRWLVVQEVRIEGVLAPFADFDDDRAGLVRMLDAIAELAPDYQSSPA
jgi:hypothetical protein